MLFEDGVHLVTGIRTNMKNKLMPMWDKIMLRKASAAFRCFSIHAMFLPSVRRVYMPSSSRDA